MLTGSHAAASFPEGSVSYCTQTDIENVFGTSNVALWSNLDQITTTANTTRITAAIAYADGEINRRFRGTRYTVPLTGGDVASTVMSWAARLAGVWLYESRGKQDEGAAKVTFHRDDVNADMAAAVLGQVKLDCAINSSTRAFGPTVIVQG